MTQKDQLKEYIDKIKTTKEFIDDFNAYKKCKDSFENYNRSDAISCLQILIKRYGAEINQLGLLTDGIRVICGVDCSRMSDFQIKDQLIYIGQRIPLYVAMREGEKKIVDEIINRIGNICFNVFD